MPIFFKGEGSKNDAFQYWAIQFYTFIISFLNISRFFGVGVGEIKIHGKFL